MCYLKFQIFWLLLLLYSNPFIISLKGEPKNYGYDSNRTFNVDASFKMSNTSKTNKTLPEFPLTLYNDFIKSHLTESFSFKQKKKDTQFLYKLLECIDTDINCAYHLGNLYFQGLVVPKIVSPYDSGKNLTRAIGLWQYAASEGNANAQYQMALVYSTMYNAPSFLMNPQDVWNHIHWKTMGKTVPKQLKCWKSHHDKIESLIQNLSPLEIHRFVLSMKILDFQGEPQKLHEYESRLVEQFVHHYYQTKQQSANYSISTMCLAKPSLSYIFSGNHSTENNLHRNLALAKTFPLHKRDGLAVLYMYLAAQGNHIGAQITLGYFHTHGLHTPQRCHAAAAYYLRVARDVVKISSHGIPQSSSNIRVSLLGLETVYDMEKLKILSVTKDLKSHYLDLQFHVARAGDPRSQTAVGKLHLFGIEHLPQNFKKAFHYFSLAAQSDYKEAISYLGYLYALGLGTERNLDMAFKLFSYVISSSDNNLGRLFKQKHNIKRKSFIAYVISMLFQ
jgi:TPR repeat protein